MRTDVADLRDFYAGPLGRVARRLVSRQIADFWDDLGNEKVVGIGYATPYLSAIRERCDRVLAFMPARQGVINWPLGGPSSSALVDDDALPLTDGAVERVLLAHCLEYADNPHNVLHEAWRVLAPGGRLVAVVANRRGLWARIDNSPFGHGRPFSRSQLTALLKGAGFSPAGWREALFMPPLTRPGLLRMGVVLERIGRVTPLVIGGALIVEAQKQFHMEKPVRAIERVRRRIPSLTQPQPVATSRTSSRELHMLK